MPRVRKPRVHVVADRPEHLAGTAEACRCYQCGGTPMACGSLCADCSWEDHLAGLGGYGRPPGDYPVPGHCRTSRRSREKRLRA